MKERPLSASLLGYKMAASLDAEFVLHENRNIINIHGRNRAGGNKCSAFNCSVSYKRSDGSVHLYRFPKNRERCKQWLTRLKVDGLYQRSCDELYKNYRVCHRHFSDEMFMNPKNKYSGLVWNAVPNTNIPNESKAKKRKAPIQREVQAKVPRRNILHEFVDSTLELIPEVNDEHHKVPLSSKKKIDSQRKKPRRLELQLREAKSVQEKIKDCLTVGEIIKASEKFIDKTSLNFFSTQMRVSSIKKKGRRWNNSDKILALSLYYSGKKSYRLLCKIFKMPSVSTVKAWMQAIPSSSGFSDPVLSILKKQFMKAKCDRDRVCALVLDEMTLKAGLKYNSNKDHIIGFEDYGNFAKTALIANEALCFMVRGLGRKWKQPIGYFFSRDATPATFLKEMVFEAINKIQAAGGIVKVIIADQGSPNRTLFKSLDISPEHPYFIHNGCKIYGFFDPPHLLKSTRNNLLKYVFKDNDSVIKWQYIRTFFEKDSEFPTKMCPKLSSKHFKLTNFSKMRVYLAAQVFSHSVAAGISTYVQFGALPAEAQHTANFVKRFDNLFDCFNSRVLKCKLKPLKGAIQQNSPHITFLQEFDDWLKSALKPVGNKGELHFLNGWRTSTNSLIHLLDDLSQNYQFKFLMTNRLNQDCIENLFSAIRRSGGNRDNPSCEEFGPAFKQCIIESILTPSKGLEDGDTIVSTLADFHSIKSVKISALDVCDSVSIIQNDIITVTDVSETINSLPQQNVLTYIAGYILYKLKRKHSCLKCNFHNVRSSNSSQMSNTEEFCYWKALCKSKGDFGGLTIPSTEFVNFVSDMETCFLNNFNALAHMNKLMLRLLTLFSKDIRYELLLCEDAMRFVQPHYLTVRIHAALKFHKMSQKKKGDESSKVRKPQRKLMKILHL